MVAFDIELNNPLDEPVFFDVIYTGIGLYGKEVFELGANQAGVYELMFSPLKPLLEQGSIAFINEKLGEIWYELKLIAEE